MRKRTNIEGLCWALFCIELTLALNATGTTYYVDARGGADGNTGQSTSSPWRSLAKVNGRSFSAGDQILLKRGEVWREALTIACSGSSGAPLVIGAYGSGPRPEINGSDVITNWRVYNGNVYVADVAHTVRQLFIDGAHQPCARWPNTGWASIDADDPEGTSLYSSALTQPANYWVGATAVIKTADFAIETRPITANSNRALHWDTAVGRWIRKGYGFYIEGHLGQADTPGEWACQGGRLYLRMAAGDPPSAHRIEAPQRDTGIALPYGQHDITIRDVSVVKFRQQAIYAYNVDRVTVQNTYVAGVGSSAMYMYTWPLNSHGDLHLIGNTIEDIRGNGIRVTGCAGAEIRDNVLTQIGTYPRSPRMGEGIFFRGQDIAVTGNRLDGVAGVGIYPYETDRCTIEGNLLKSCMTLLCDGGAFYVGDTRAMHLTVRNNVICDVQGNADGTPWNSPACVGGIYLDSGPATVTVEGNIVYDCRSWGLFVHDYGADNTIVNNVFYDCGTGILLQEKRKNGISNHVVRNNVCFDTAYSQSTIRVLRHADSTAPVGSFDRNVYYCPTRTHTILYRPPAGSEARMTLAEWRAASGQDAHSIAEDPRFADAPAADFHIRPDSPCVDAGANVGRSADMDGNPIPAGAAPDIGAYELGGVRISAGTDDAEEALDTGAVTTSSSDLELGEEAADQLVGLRFARLAIPRGAVIEEARVQFTIDETGSEPAALVIDGEAGDNAAAFARQARNLSNRGRTRAYARWEPAAWTTPGTAGNAQRTPDLAAIVQEIVDRPGWQRGNALVLLIRGSGRRVAVSYDGNRARSATLQITYRVRRFRAFNDLAWLDGEPDTGITRYTLAQAGPLVDCDSGARLDATLAVSGSGHGPTSQGGKPAPGTDADRLFGGIVGCAGLISHGTADLTLTFTNLTEPGVRYTVALYGNRAEPAYSDRYTEYRLYGADTFINASSPGANWAGPADPAATLDTSDNTAKGCVARFTDITPGEDGSFSVRVCDGYPDDLHQFYVNAVLLQADDAAGGGLLVPMGAAWKYNDTGSDLGTRWRAGPGGYDDAAWHDGKAPQGFGEPDIVTALSYGTDANAKYPTTYFRRRFFLAARPPAAARLLLRARYDDGFVAYLNGREVARRAMPAGPVGYNTLASSHEGDAIEPIDLSAHVDTLREGENVLAVELHQSVPDSSDLLLDMELALNTAGGRHGTVCVNRGGMWRCAKGTREASTPAAAWRGVFDDARWIRADAPVGYGDGPYQTVLSDMRDSYTCVYLRQTFDMPDSQLVGALCLDLLYDDGIVVWINGREVARANVAGLPGSFVPCDAVATQTVEPARRDALQLAGAAMPPLWPTGNVLAVQCLNSARSSSDLTVDVALSAWHGPMSMALDADQDGLPDAWESARFGDPATCIRDADRDGDGMGNLQEYICGTDPDDPTDSWQLEIRPNGGSVEVSFLARAAGGTGYSNMTRWFVLETKPAAGDGDWLPAPGYAAIEGRGQTVTYRIPGAAGQPPAWHRARAWLVDAGP
ncbi:MAG: right-handed parallel beta-helix repeat-containing protein [Kiritimatiellae bacterium]|nr:right-handed parallel beta-helix repeat-containing protein [Kiritimatiellia bacterium]